MATLSERASALRSKNAGPFWVTIDVFFDSDESFDAVSAALSSVDVATRLKVETASLQRYDLRDIAVIKFSFPRPVVQGMSTDRDMHGAQYAWVLSDIELN